MGVYDRNVFLSYSPAVGCQVISLINSIMQDRLFNKKYSLKLNYLEYCSLLECTFMKIKLIDKQEKQLPKYPKAE